MGKRFSRLKYALRAIQDPTSDASANTPPTNSILDNYNEFATGSRQVSYPRDSDSFQGETNIIGVVPFGLELSQANIVRVGIGKRALDYITAQTLTTPAGIETNQELAVLELKGYTPAKAIVFVQAATQPTQPETSQITGIPYKKTEGVSYTVPYGQSTGTTKELAVRASIQTTVSNIARASVSFKSEKL